MENTQELLTDSLIGQESSDSQVEIKEAKVDFESNATLMQGPESPVDSKDSSVQPSVLDLLIERRTGMYKVKLDIADLKWIKNACNTNKFKFVGPNEAFMVMNCFMGASAAISKLEQAKLENAESDGTVEMQAAAVEAAAILLNKYESSGLESAQRVFRIAIALNSAVMEMKQLDQIINQLKIEEAKNDELKSQEENANGSAI